MTYLAFFITSYFDKIVLKNEFKENSMKNGTTYKKLSKFSHFKKL